MLIELFNHHSQNNVVWPLACYDDIKRGILDLVTITLSESRKSTVNADRSQMYAVQLDRHVQIWNVLIGFSITIFGITQSGLWHVMMISNAESSIS